MSLLKFSDIARFFEELELKLIASLRRNLRGHKDWEESEGFKWTAWQAQKLRNLNNFRRENAKILGGYTEQIDADTRRLIEEQFHEGEMLADEAAGADSIPDSHFFGVNNDKMQNLMNNITQLEKDASSAALRMVDDVYRQTLNKVQLEMATGSVTLPQAIDDAVSDFLAKGINCIVYKDGSRVNVADYVRMALRTTSTRASLQGMSKRWSELGYDTVLVSQYSMCSETCLPWQGQVYIDDVFTEWNGERAGDIGRSNYCGKWFTLLSVAIRAGLFHPNCRHTLTLYRDGVTKIPELIDGEKIKKQRQLEQKQRALEKKVRKFKRLEAGTQSPKIAAAYRKELRQAQHELKVFVDEHNDVLKRDYSRENVYNGEISDNIPKWLTEIDEDDRIDLEKFKRALNDSQVNITIYQKQQIKHQSSPEWRNQVKQALQSNGSPKSRLYNHIDPQEVVDSCSGKGILQSRKRNKCVDEFVSLPYPVGVSYDKKSGKYVQTHRVQIKYTKDGTHVIPVLERGK